MATGLSFAMPSFEYRALRDVERLFGDVYRNIFVDVLRHNNPPDSILHKPQPMYRPGLPCPYCYGNSNYKACGQCNGLGEVAGLSFTPSGFFNGVIRLARRNGLFY
jgi:hypothetical protein